MELLRCLVHRIGRSLTRIADPPMMLSCFLATIFSLSFDEPLHTLTPIGIIPCGHRKRAQIRGRRGPYDGAKKKGGLGLPWRSGATLAVPLRTHAHEHAP
jgi:hypothetical protein